MVAYGIIRESFYLALPSGDATSGKGSLRSVLVARRGLLRAAVHSNMMFICAGCASLNFLNEAFRSFLSIDVTRVGSHGDECLQP